MRSGLCLWMRAHRARPSFQLSHKGEIGSTTDRKEVGGGGGRNKVVRVRIRRLETEKLKSKIGGKKYLWGKKLD